MVYKLGRFLCRLWLKVCYRLHVEIEEDLKGGAIMAPSHSSHLDPIVVGSSWPRDIHFLARDTLFGPRLGPILKRVHVHPIRRGESDHVALKKAMNLLSQGHKLVMFPEGKRSEDGNLQPAEQGVAMISLHLGCPVIPVYVDGTFDVWSRHRKKPKRFGKIQCLFGKVLDPKDFLPLGKKKAREEMTTAIMDEIARLKKKCS